MAETAANPKLKFRLGDKVITYDLSYEVQIDADKLNQALIEQPSKFAYIATVHAAYKGAAEGAKIKLDIASCKMDGLLRQDAVSNGEKVTEAVIAARIKQSKPYTDALKDWEELAGIERQLSVAVESFRQRKDMLIALASNWRAERDMQISIKQGAYHEALSGKGATLKA